MTAYPVSTRVNNPAYDSPACIAPLAGLPPLEALLNVGGESHLVVRSGLRFTTLTVGQHAALAQTLQDLAAAFQPIA
jgi:hypothetical protein